MCQALSLLLASQAEHELASVANLGFVSSNRLRQSDGFAIPSDALARFSAARTELERATLERSDDIFAFSGERAFRASLAHPPSPPSRERLSRRAFA